MSLHESPHTSVSTHDGMAMVEEAAPEEVTTGDKASMLRTYLHSKQPQPHLAEQADAAGYVDPRPHDTLPARVCCKASSMLLHMC
jgi:hypothetical protein